MQDRTLCSILSGRTVIERSELTAAVDPFTTAPLFGNLNSSSKPTLSLLHGGCT